MLATGEASAVPRCWTGVSPTRKAVTAACQSMAAIGVPVLVPCWMKRLVKSSRWSHLPQSMSRLVPALSCSCALELSAAARFLSAADPQAVALSEKLRASPAHPGVARDERFRNPSGVALKLMNFRAVERAVKRDLGIAGADALPAGMLRAVWAFVMVLACSRHMFVRPVLKLDQRAWTECHVLAFEFFGGAPARLTPDNLRTGVERPDLYDPKINRSYAELAAHYGCLVDPARVTETS
jgi:hypothetical protein